MTEEFRRNASQDGGGSRLHKIERAASLVGGGALAFFGMSRKSWKGAALAATGGYLIYRGVRRRAPELPIHIQKTFTIMRPVQEVYAFWRDFSNLPKAMQHLKEVRIENGRFSHWTLRGPLGRSIEWDAELTEQKQDEYLSWKTSPGSPIEHQGSVQFSPTLEGEATELSVHLSYTQPGGKLGGTFVKLFGEHPEQQVREDLRALKALLETGEIPTIEGQPSGKRSTLVRLGRAIRTQTTQPPMAEQRTVAG